MLRLLKFLLLLGGGFLLLANIEPYISLTQLIFGTTTTVDVCAQLRPFPFLGGMLAGGCSVIGTAIFSISGFIVWAVFQLIELLPICNSFNVPFLSGVLHKLQNAPQVEEKEGDRLAVQKAKRKFNTTVERSLSALLTFAWVMYLVDLALMSWLYSPLNEIGELNWMALIRVLLGVFGVELVILGVTLISNIIDPASVKFAKSETKPVREY